MKLERAKRQKQEFDDVLRSFFSTTPYKFTGKPDFKSNKVLYTIDEVQPVPSEVPLIAGDIIHNLRSALDHLAYQLYRKKHPDREGKHVQFPIAETKVDYYRKDGVKWRQTRGMSAEAIAAIDSVQPYGGGNDVLWHLHKLDIINKHRLLLTVGSAVHGVNLWPLMQQKMLKTDAWLADVNRPLFFGVKDNCYPLEVGTLVFEDKTSTEVCEIPMTFEVVLYEKDIVEGKSLEPELQAMIDVVEKVITDLTRFIV